MEPINLCSLNLTDENLQQSKPNLFTHTLLRIFLIHRFSNTKNIAHYSKKRQNLLKIMQL